MNQGEFDQVVKQTARQVTVARGALNATVSMASAIASGEEELMMDATQDDSLVTFLQSEFGASALVKPDRYDRVTDADGRVYSIQMVRNMHGISGQLWGFKAIIRGNE